MAPPDEEISLADLLDTVLQNILLISICIVVAVLLGAGYAYFATPIYRADALIQVEDKKSGALVGVQQIAEALGGGASPVSGEIEILRSREVVMQAIRATKANIQVKPIRFPVIGEWYARRHSRDGVMPPLLGLSNYAWGGEVLSIDEFMPPTEAGYYEFIIRATEQGFNIESSEGVVLASGVVGKLTEFVTNEGPFRISVRQLVARPGVTFVVSRTSEISTYLSMVPRLMVAEAARQSNIIRISFDDKDLDFSKAFVNAVATAYLKQNVERRSAEADQSLQFLEGQLPRIKETVERAEEELNKFRTKTSTISVEKAADGLLSQAIDVEKGRLQLELKREELLQRYKPEHPLVKALDAQLQAAVSEEKQVASRINQLPAAQRDLLRLQRDVEVNNQLYISLLNNAQQLKVARAGTTGNVRIIDFAVKNYSPVAPRKALIVVVAAVLGLAIGITAAMVRRLLRPTVRHAEELERALGVVSYASIPESSLQEKLDSAKRDRQGKRAIVQGRVQLLAVLHPDDSAVESMRSLRTGLTFALMDAPNKNIVITGATESLGKSFISANLSALLAISGQRILLIETDLRRPQLGTYFGYSDVPGLSELLSGTVSFENAVQRIQVVPNLEVLPAGAIPPNPGELLLSQRFERLLEDVQDKYDHIILDSAPILPVGDTLAIARCAATIFMVARAEQSTVAEVRDAIKKLESSNYAVKGIIFNGVKRRRVMYGASYKYYYGYGK